MNKIFIAGVLLMLVCGIGVIYENNQEPEQITPTESKQIQKIPLYYNLDDPNTAYIKNSEGKYEEVGNG